MRSAGRKRRHSDDELKQPLSALFCLFLASIRSELRADRRSAAEQAKLAGEQWNAMSPEEKAPFNDEADGKSKAYRER